MAWGRNNRRGGGGNNRRGSSDREFEKLAQVSLWEIDAGRNGPVLNGVLQDADGNEIARISLWEGTSNHSKAPVLTGSITREVNGGGKRRSAARGAPDYDDPEEEEFDDDIPF